MRTAVSPSASLLRRAGLPEHASPGNRVLRQQAGVIARLYTASKKQRTALTKAVAARWQAAIDKDMTDVKTVVDALVETSASHRDAIDAVDTRTYAQWNWGESMAQQPPPPPDPFARVKKAIRDAGESVDDFGEPDLRTIETLVEQTQLGYQGAVRQIADQKRAEQENARLREERSKRYDPPWEEGKQVFNTPLLTAVWNAAHTVATAGDANKNASVGGLWPDAQVLPAVATWRAQGTIGVVDNFHVPGGNQPIEDKSLRGGGETRGRQADFISNWGGDINVHVDADPQH